MINNLDIVQDGPWTWIDRQDSSRKSCLDLAIMSSSLLPYLSKVVVDKEHKFTPRRVLKTRKGIKSTYTDHFSLKIELKGIPKKQQQEKQQITWNLNKPGGWSDYKTTTNKEAHKITEAVHEETDIEKVMKKINSIDNVCRFY